MSSAESIPSSTSGPNSWVRLLTRREEPRHPRSTSIGGSSTTQPWRGREKISSGTTGTLPVWAAVEVLDWGRLTHLFGMSPLAARDSVAHDMRLSAPQLESWMKSLNILRNYSAHHGRVFNRVFALTPKLPKGDDHPELSDIAPSMNRAFGQLSIVQYLLKTLRAGNPQVLPAVLRSFPDVEIVPISHTGAPSRWALSPLWS